MPKFLNNINLETANDIQFKKLDGTNAGKISQTGDDLVISNAVGDILLGNGSDDVYIGDGTNAVDIRFEQNMAIFADSGSAKTLTLGGSNTNLVLESPTLNNATFGATTMSGKLTFTGNTGYILFDYEPSGDTGEYTNEVPLLKIDHNGSEKTILSRVSENGALQLGNDDTVLISAGDVGDVMKTNWGMTNEYVVLAAEGGFYAYGFPDNDTTWSNRNEFRFRSDSATASDNGLYIGDGGNTQFIDLSRNLTVGTIASGAITSTKSSSHTAQGSFSASDAHLDLYNSLAANTDQKGSILTFTDNYYDGSNYHKTTRAGIKGGTDQVGNTANGYLEFYTDSGAANSPNLALRLDSSQNATFEGKVVTTEVESAGALELDAVADITIDAGGGDIILSDDGEIFGTLSRSGNDLQIRSRKNDGDMLFRGVDSNTEFTALTLDMSSAGKATFNNSITGTDFLELESSGDTGHVNSYILMNATQSDARGAGVYMHNTNADKEFYAGVPYAASFDEYVISYQSTADHSEDTATTGNAVFRLNSSGLGTFAAGVTLTAGPLSISGDGSNYATLTESGSGTLTIATVDDFVVDSAVDITLDAAGNDIRLKSAGTTFGTFTKASDHFFITSNVQDGDIKFSGNDNGSSVTALILDMSDAGAAYFNSWIYTSGGGIGRDAHNIIDFSTDNQITFKTDNTTALTIDSSQDATFAGNIAVSGTVDGRDIATDGTKLDGIATSANNYVHPTNAGNKHIPAGGASGNFLKYSSAGTAVWSTPTKSDVGLGNVSNVDQTNASNITSGTLAASRVATLNQNTTGSAASLSGLSLGDIVAGGESGYTTVSGNTASSNKFLRSRGAASTATIPAFETIGASDISGLGSLATASSVSNSNWSGTDLSVANGGTGRSTLSSGQVLLGNGTSGINSRAIGISDDNIVEIDSSDVASGEYARFTANGLESRSTAEVLSDIGAQASGNYITGSGSLSAQDLTDIGNLSGTNSGDVCTTNHASAGYLTSSSTASKVTVTDANADTAFPVVFHDESDGLLDDTGALTYNPGSGRLETFDLGVRNKIFADDDSGGDTYILFADGDIDIMVNDTNLSDQWSNAYSALSSSFIGAVDHQNGVTFTDTESLGTYTTTVKCDSDLLTFKMDHDGTNKNAMTIKAKGFTETPTGGSSTTTASTGIGFNQINPLFGIHDSRPSSPAADWYLVNGSIGVGTTPHKDDGRGDFTGIVTASNVTSSSDARVKKDIKNIPSHLALDVVKQLQGVRFNWLEENDKSDWPEYHKPKKQNGIMELGFIAQDVEKVLPEVVNTDDHRKGFKTVEYAKMVAVLTEAIKEQQKQIDKLQKQIKELL